jgi:hypothetical protein
MSFAARGRLPLVMSLKSLGYQWLFDISRSTAEFCAVAMSAHRLKLPAELMPKYKFIFHRTCMCSWASRINSGQLINKSRLAALHLTMRPR